MESGCLRVRTLGQLSLEWAGNRITDGENRSKKVWLLLACLIALLILMGWESAGLVLQFFGMFVLAPLVLGLGASFLAYHLYWKKRSAAEDPARPWKRQ